MQCVRWVRRLPVMSGYCRYGICDGSGFLLSEGGAEAVPCKCRQELVATRRHHALSAAIPKRFRGVSFERNPVALMPKRMVEPVRAFCQNLEEHLAQGRGIWFTGSVGTGKSTLAMLIAAEAMRRGVQVAVYRTPALLAQLRRSLDADHPQELGQLIDRLSSVPLLVLDDLGAERSSDWVLEQLYVIIDSRWTEQRSLVVATNLDDQMLVDQLGPRIASRIVGICGEPVRCDDLDHHTDGLSVTSHDPPGGSAPFGGEPRDRTA